MRSTNKNKDRFWEDSKAIKIISAVIVFAALAIAAFFAFNSTPASAGHICWVCDEWIPDGEDYCLVCYCCVDCSSEFCHSCMACEQCWEDLSHCEDCYACLVDTGIAYCEICGRCEDCTEVLDSGHVCMECYEENVGDEGLCDYCHNYVIKDDDGNFFDGCAECGNHCEECFELLQCPECGECSECNEAPLCDTCGICENCVVEYGYHCPECGECYEDIPRCNEGGDHCSNCCEENGYLCENCGVCVDGEGLDKCDGCNLCENCFPEYHCEMCGECFEYEGQCEEGGSHCLGCCQICENCGECAIGNGIEICDFCDYCTNCCNKISESIGLHGICAGDPKSAEKMKAIHDSEGVHFLSNVPTEGGHVYGCIVDGCQEHGAVLPHRPGDWTVISKPTMSKEGICVRSCLDCGAEIERRTLEKVTYSFTKQPSSGAVKNGSDFYLDYEIISNYGEPCHLYQCVFFRTDGGEWETDIQKAYASFVYESIPYSEKLRNTNYEWRLCVYDGLSHYFYSEPFKIEWSDNHTHHYILKNNVKSDTFGKADGSGTCHQYVCSCGKVKETLAHVPIVLYSEQSCIKIETKYMCIICGEMWTISKNEAGSHVSNGIYSCTDEGHYTECKYCHIRMDDTHSYKIIKSSTVCEIETREEICTACGDKRTVVEQASNPNHTFNYNWIHGNNEIYHWNYCIVCGLRVDEKHHMVDAGDYSYCDKCYYYPDTNGGLEIWMSDMDVCSHIGTITPRFSSTDDALLAKVMSGVGVTYSWSYYSNGNKIVLSTSKTLEISKELEKTVAADDSLDITLEVYLDGVFLERQTVTIQPLGDIEGTAPTCSKEGKKAHYICTCGRPVDTERNVIDVSIPKTAHSYSDDCDVSCNVCGELRVANHNFAPKYDDEEHFIECTVCGLVRDLTPHNLTLTINKEASCFEKGSYTAECSCGFHKTEEVPKLSHNIQPLSAVPSTCVTKGHRAYCKCIYCGKTFNSTDENDSAPLKDFFFELDPQNHEGGNYHCDEKMHWIVCACGEKLNSEQHTLDEKGRCTVCKYSEKTLIKPSVIVESKKEDTKPDDGNNGSKDPQKTGKFSTVLLVILIIVALIIVAAILIILLLLKKKQEALKSNQDYDGRQS